MDLLDELDSVDAGSRTADAAIQRWLDPGRAVKWQDGKLYSTNGYVMVEVPHFTTNLVDALSLLPDGLNWRWRVERYNVDADSCRCELAEVGQVLDFGIGIKTRVQANAKTPELAVCIAMIKARTGANEMAA